MGGGGSEATAAVAEAETQGVVREEEEDGAIVWVKEAIELVDKGNTCADEVSADERIDEEEVTLEETEFLMYG